jgi:hypothetical protein
MNTRPRRRLIAQISRRTHSTGPTHSELLRARQLPHSRTTDAHPSAPAVCLPIAAFLDTSHHLLGGIIVAATTYTSSTHSPPPPQLPLTATHHHHSPPLTTTTHHHSPPPPSPPLTTHHGHHPPLTTAITHHQVPGGEDHPRAHLRLVVLERVVFRADGRDHHRPSDRAQVCWWRCLGADQADAVHLPCPEGRWALIALLCVA